MCTAEMPVGEGRQDGPVGTTLALIEQATKILAAVHINLHDAQSEEFQILKDRYRENPESFWKWSKLKNQPKWEREMFLRALEDYELVPAADPNTASHTIRLIKCQAVKTVAMMRPELYDMKKVDEWIFKMIGVSDPDQFFAPPPDPNQMPPDPTIVATMLQVEAKKAEIQAKAQADMAKLEMEASQDRAEHEMRLIELATEHQQRLRESKQGAQETALESADRAADRQSEERRILLKMFSDMMRQHQQAQNQTRTQAGQQQHQAATQARDQQHQHMQGQQDRQHQVFAKTLDQRHQKEQQQTTLEHQKEQAERQAKQKTESDKKPPRKF